MKQSNSIDRETDHKRKAHEAMKLTAKTSPLSQLIDDDVEEQHVEPYLCGECSFCRVGFQLGPSIVMLDGLCVALRKVLFITTTLMI